MNDRQKIINLIIDKIRKDYSADVKLAVMYGSFANGTWHEKSDVDFFFVPKTERGWKLNLSFIVDGIGYDFWGMGESRMKRMADEFQPLAGILRHGILIYADQESSRQEFCDLQSRLEAISADPDPLRLRGAVEERLRNAKVAAFDARQGKGAFRRYRTAGLVVSLCEALSALNRRLLKYGWKRLLEETGAFPLVPEGFVTACDRILSGEASPGEAEALVSAVERFWNGIVSRNAIPPSVAELAGFYEEASSTYRKMEHAEATGDLRLAYFTALSLDREIRGINADFRKDLPSVFPEGLPADLPRLASRAQSQEVSLVEMLQTEGVPIRRFSGPEEFARFLDSV